MMRSERSQHKRPRIVWFCLDEMPRRGKATETDRRPVVARGWGQRNGEGLLMGTGFLSWMMKISGIRAMAAQLSEYTKLHQTAHFFKRMNLMLRELYLNQKKNFKLKGKTMLSGLPCTLSSHRREWNGPPPHCACTLSPRGCRAGRHVQRSRGRNALGAARMARKPGRGLYVDPEDERPVAPGLGWLWSTARGHRCSGGPAPQAGHRSGSLRPPHSLGHPLLNPPMTLKSG